MFGILDWPPALKPPAFILPAFMLLAFKPPAFILLAFKPPALEVIDLVGTACAWGRGEVSPPPFMPGIVERAVTVDSWGVVLAKAAFV